MQGKFTSSTLILFLVLVLFSMSLLLVVEAAGDIFTTQQEIESLIEAGQLTDGQVRTEQLQDDYSQDPNLPGVLYSIAESHRLLCKYNQAKNIHRQIIQDYPGSLYANRAQLAISRMEVLSLVISRNYQQAEETLDELITEFPGHQDLPETLYWVGREFGWWNRFEKEKSLYQQVVQKYPDSRFAVKSQLDSSRAQVMSLIVSEQYDTAQAAFIKLVDDFSENPDLPETLYRIGKVWVWAGNNCTAANSIYKKITEDFPNSIYAGKSQTYLQITQRCMDIFVLIESGQAQTARNEIGRLVTDFSGQELLPHMVFLCGERYFSKACNERDQDLGNEATEDFARAIEVWKKITEELPASGTTPEGYYHLAIAYRQIGEYALAIEHYTRVVEDYPNYRLVWDAQFMIGHTYEQLLKLGLLSESTANPLIASAYKKVLDKYPDCKAAKAAHHWLEKSGSYTTGEGVADSNEVSFIKSRS